MPPTRLATNGVPQAAASLSTVGNPSERLGSTKSVAARYHSGNSSLGFGPSILIWLLKLKTSDLSLQSLPHGPLSDHETGESHPISLEMRARLDQHVEALDGEQVADEQDDRNLGWKPQTLSSLLPRTGPEDLPVDSRIDDMNVPRRGTQLHHAPRQVLTHRHDTVRTLKDLDRSVPASPVRLSTRISEPWTLITTGNPAACPSSTAAHPSG